METLTLCAPEHQEVFRRVWARVMGSDENCPVQALPPEGLEGDLSCRQLELLSRAGGQAGGDRLPAPPAASANLCLHIRQALEGWQCYRHLAHRARGAAGSLSALASDAWRSARQLAAVYFLRTGVRYWPAGALPAPTHPSLWGALRRRHQAEEQFRQTCLDSAQAAEAAQDQELARLYQTLAQDCQHRCRQLLSLLERLGP